VDDSGSVWMTPNLHFFGEGNKTLLQVGPKWTLNINSGFCRLRDTAIVWDNFFFLETFFERQTKISRAFSDGLYVATAELQHPIPQTEAISDIVRID